MSIAIRIDNVSKLYRLGVVGTGTISHDLNRWWHKLQGKEDPYAKVGQVNDRTAGPQKQQTNGKQQEAESGLSPEYVWALKDINLKVEQGEILGIIGRNGAGKSTLLKLLSRVTAPTTGTIKARGRIASLLEVGTGFHPELTGRENIYLNGAILGMKRHEITKQLDAIVDFSGCAKYLDTPVKRYSSGMTVRLGFAVAAHVQPEVLIVDEVLAVGDASFQEKCLGKMSDLSNEGRTVLFVSHSMAAIERLTHKCSVINDGKLVYEGLSTDAVDYYLDHQKRNLAASSDVSQLPRVSWAGDQAVKLASAELPDLHDGALRGGQPIRMRLGVVGQQDVSSFWFGITLNYRDGTPVGSAFCNPCSPITSHEHQMFEVQLHDPLLAPGHYWMTVGLLRESHEVTDVLHEVLHFDIHAPERLPTGHVDWNPGWGRLRLDAMCSLQ